MIPDEQQKNELERMLKDVPSSSIPIKVEEVIIPKIPANINALNQEMWGTKSNKLLSDYRYGENLALYGENDLTTKVFFKRLSAAFCAIISNEFQKRGVGAETIKPLYNIFESCLLLMSKEIDKQGWKDQDILAIISSLHGFVTNYNQKREIK